VHVSHCCLLSITVLLAFKALNHVAIRQFVLQKIIVPSLL
jgi:hypothetical protein